MKTVLLDTHTYLWFIENDPALSAVARKAIENAGVAYVSVASAWEIAVKFGKGKLKPGHSLAAIFGEDREKSGIELLPVSLSQVLAVAELPRGQHGDPFDRLLVVQALELQVEFISTDSLLDAYGVRRVW